MQRQKVPTPVCYGDTLQGLAHQSGIDGILPDGQSWAGSLPDLHDLFVGARMTADPLNQVQHQRLVSQALKELGLFQTSSPGDGEFAIIASFSAVLAPRRVPSML